MDKLKINEKEILIESFCDAANLVKFQVLALHARKRLILRELSRHNDFKLELKEIDCQIDYLTNELDKAKMQIDILSRQADETRLD